MLTPAAATLAAPVRMLRRVKREPAFVVLRVMTLPLPVCFLRSCTCWRASPALLEGPRCRKAAVSRGLLARERHTVFETIRPIKDFDVLHGPAADILHAPLHQQQRHAAADLQPW